MNGRSCASIAAVVASLTLPVSAGGQCEDAGADGVVDPTIVGTLRDTFPADRDLDVPLNSPIRLRYYGSVPSHPVVCVRREGDDAPCLEGTSAALDDEIVWQPLPVGGAPQLEAGQRYRVRYREAFGGDGEITFTTGRGTAPARPAFAGIGEVTSEHAPDQSCNPASADITVTFDRASSGATGPGETPWPANDFEYVIYETRGPGISGPRERDRARLQNSGSSLVTRAQRTFLLTSVEASGPVCFNVQALDPLGRSDGNTREECVNPAKGNYFVGCSARPSRPSTMPWVVALGLAGARRRNARAKGGVGRSRWSLPRGRSSNSHEGGDR